MKKQKILFFFSENNERTNERSIERAIKLEVLLLGATTKKKAKSQMQKFLIYFF